jgi:thioredoxin 1
MPTFLVFKSGSVSETIRGANPAALRNAISRASSDAGKGPAKQSVNFQTRGYTLGSSSTGSRPVNSGPSWLGGLGTGSGAGGFADSIVRFMGLYLTTLFSFDSYAAAEASPFKVGRRRR